MPLAGWNGKFHGIGNGGHGGTINYTGRQPRAGMAEALKRGYATASTDTGHTIETGSTFLGQPMKLVDYELADNVGRLRLEGHRPASTDPAPAIAADQGQSLPPHGCAHQNGNR
jgi:hypothetical protein